MSTELTVIEKMNPVEVFTKEGGAVPIVEEIEKFYRSIDRDVSTNKGRDNIRSIAHKIGGNKAEFERAKTAVKDALKKQVDIIDGEARTIKTRLEALQEEIRAPLTAFEQKEKTRVKTHEERLQAISDRTLFIGETPTSETVQQRLDSLKDFEGAVWEEFAERGKQSFDAAKKVLLAALSQRKEQEAQAAELERLKAEEAERKRQEELKAAAEAARIVAEEKAAAEARAVAEKEKAEKDRIEAQRAAAEKAAADARAAKEAAEAKAKADATAAEAKRVADLAAAAEKAEKEKAAAVAAEQKRAADARAAEEAATAKREADTAHRKKINGEALAAMVQAGLSNDAAKIIITAIAKGSIPHVSIGY